MQIRVRSLNRTRVELKSGLKVVGVAAAQV